MCMYYETASRTARTILIGHILDNKLVLKILTHVITYLSKILIKHLIFIILMNVLWKYRNAQYSRPIAQPRAHVQDFPPKNPIMMTFVYMPSRFVCMIKQVKHTSQLCHPMHVHCFRRVIPLSNNNKKTREKSICIGHFYFSYQYKIT